MIFSFYYISILPFLIKKTPYIRVSFCRTWSVTIFATYSYVPPYVHWITRMKTINIKTIPVYFNNLLWWLHQNEIIISKSNNLVVIKYILIIAITLYFVKVIFPFSSLAKLNLFNVLQIKIICIFQECINCHRSDASRYRR